MSAPAKITLGEIAARIPAHQAQLAVAKIFAAVGSIPEWDSETIEHVLNCLGEIHDDLFLPWHASDLPDPYSTRADSQEFWDTIEEA